MLAGRMAMHACQSSPKDTAPPCPGSPHQACLRTRRECFVAGNLSAPISPLLLVCADGATKNRIFCANVIVRIRDDP